MQYLDELKNTLEDFSCGKYDCASAILDVDDGYVVKVVIGAKETLLTRDEIPNDLRELVIWTFTENGAYIKLPKPINYVQLLAELMAGNLFGQGLANEAAPNKRM